MNLSGSLLVMLIVKAVDKNEVHARKPYIDERMRSLNSLVGSLDVRPLFGSLSKIIVFLLLFLLEK